MSPVMHLKLACYRLQSHSQETVSRSEFRSARQCSPYPVAPKVIRQRKHMQGPVIGLASGLSISPVGKETAIVSPDLEKAQHYLGKNK